MVSARTAAARRECFLFFQVMLYILNLLCAVCVVVANVHEKNGLLTISRYRKCSINFNGEQKTMELNGSEYMYPGYAIGLIKWKCDNEYGNIITKVECKPCGLYCAYNQQFTKCANNWTVIIMGAVIGLLIALVIGLTLWVPLRNLFHRTTIKIVFWVLTRDDRKRYLMVKRLNKITGTMNAIILRKTTTANEELNEMIKDYRLKLRAEVTGDEPEYEEVVRGSESVTSFTN